MVDDARRLFWNKSTRLALDRVDRGHLIIIISKIANIVIILIIRRNVIIALDLVNQGHLVTILVMAMSVIIITVVLHEVFKD